MILEELQAVYWAYNNASLSLYLSLSLFLVLSQKGPFNPETNGSDQSVLQISAPQRLHPEPDWERVVHVVPQRGLQVRRHVMAQFSSREPTRLPGETHNGPTQHLRQVETAMRRGDVGTGTSRRSPALLFFSKSKRMTLRDGKVFSMGFSRWSQMSFLRLNVRI